MEKKKVLTVGSGLGGLSAAAYLATEGYDVEIFEKNKRIGGKLNYLEREGFKFDLGPLIFTMPPIFNQLFERANKDMDDYFKFTATYFADKIEIIKDNTITKIFNREEIDKLDSEDRLYE